MVILARRVCRPVHMCRAAHADQSGWWIAWLSVKFTSQTVNNVLGCFRLVPNNPILVSTHTEVRSSPAKLRCFRDSVYIGTGIQKFGVLQMTSVSLFPGGGEGSVFVEQRLHRESGGSEPCRHPAAHLQPSGTQCPESLESGGPEDREGAETSCHAAHQRCISCLSLL